MDPTAAPDTEARGILRHSLILALFLALAAAGPVRPRAKGRKDDEVPQGPLVSARGMGAGSRCGTIGPINNNDTVVLIGNVNPLAQPQADYGFADPARPMARIILTLKMGPKRRAALNRLLAEQQDPTSPLYHQWLTPEEFGHHFGPSRSDLATVTRWLESQGFTIDEVAKGRMWINFSGTVAEVESAFHTEIHRYYIDGVMHHANATDPSIPRALSGVVAGIVSLGDFRLKALNAGFKPLNSEDAAAVIAKGQKSSIHPEWSGTANGTAGVYMSPIDWATVYSASNTTSSNNGNGVKIGIVARTDPGTTNWSTFRSDVGLPANTPTIIINGTDPGDLGAAEDGEADLDAEWSGGCAPGATVDFVTSASTRSTDGVDLSAQYIVDNNLTDVMSTSFGSCESAMGTSENNLYNNLWSQAASQGITAFVSSGDSGAAGCTGGNSSSGSGYAGVNGLASTPYDVAVGATEISNSSNYWNAQGNAISYIPETPWNESGTVSGGSGLWATSSGPSSVYSRPSWQVCTGVPSGSYRLLPDVCLDGSDMFFGNYGIFIYTQGQMETTGGTSAASPSWAGVMALIVQQYGRQGNANPRLYTLGSAQYAGTGPTVFHDITSGNNNVPGLTGWAATTAWDEVTGLGTPNVDALRSDWTPCTPPGTPTGLSATAPANNQIALSWSSGNQAGSSYNVYRAAGACGSSGSFSLIASGITAMSYTDATVSGGTTYAYEVSAVDSTGSCQSALSGCASATATGTCTLPPVFAGLASVTNPQSATCTLALAWTAATPQCSPGDAVYYNVYRSTVSPFTPSASNRIATGVTGTSFSDDYGLASSTMYYYIVRSVDAANGAEDSNTVTFSSLVSGPYSSGTFLDNVESGVVSQVSEQDANWSIQTCAAHSATHSWHMGQTDCTGIPIDGGTYSLVYSVKVGPYANLGSASFYHTFSAYYGSGYTDTIYFEIDPTDSGNWTTVASWQASSGSWSTMREAGPYDLSSYSSSASGLARFRFRFVGGANWIVRRNTAAGWNVDDFQVSYTTYSTCTTGVALGSVKPVPDGRWVPGTPMQASKVAADGSTINLTWDTTTCTDANYNLYWGDGSDLPTYALQGSVCGLGNTGSASGLALPPVPSGQSFIWWVIVGTDGSQMESSWGKDSAGNERHLAASGQCGFTAKSTAATCP